MIVSVDLQTKIDRGERLRILRSLLGLTLVEFAALCSVSEKTVRKWEKGMAYGLTAKRAQEILASVPQTKVIWNLEWLLEGIGDPPRYMSKSSKSLSSQRTPDGLAPNEYMSTEIEQYSQNVKNAIVMRLIDDGMEPIFNRNDYVAGIKYQGAHIQSLHDKICIVSTEQYGILVRKIRFDQHHNSYTLLTININTKVALPIITGIQLDFAAPVLRRWIHDKEIY